MQEIVPGLFLGPYASATKKSLGEMLAANLTHVVCVRSSQEAHLIRPNHEEHFNYLTVDMEDSKFQSLIPILKIVHNFIEQCLNTGGKVLVHGNLGMSRSGALVVGYIMAKYGVSLKKAATYVESKRFCIDVATFRQQLSEYQPIYQATRLALQQEQAAAGGDSAQFRVTKRSIEEINDSDDEEQGNKASRSPKDTDENLMEVVE